MFRTIKLIIILLATASTALAATPDVDQILISGKLDQGAATLESHLKMFRLPVLEPKRMEVALTHLEQTMSFSRQMWKRVLAETDDDHEWIPNPKQTGAINIRVTDEMVQQWMVALQEMESILQGKKLLPFWRGKQTYGVNLRRVFLEPTPLDLVLWMQGTAAIPYLEEGELTPSATWQQINQTFNGQFLGFGLWFN